MAQKASFDIRLQGYTPANRDAEITLVNQTTGAVVKRKPFLDGQLLLRDLDPGPYEMTVAHPNLIQPIDRRQIRLIPQRFPTRVPVIVKPDLFRDTPIRDIPDANLAPVQQAAATTKEQVVAFGGKAPGEVIRSDDWNGLVGAVSDLAGALLELTALVAPIGHNHPEIEEKFAEVQGNIRRFSESFGSSLVQLRRDIENQSLRRNVVDVLDRAGAATAVRDRILNRIGDLEQSVQQATPVFTSKLANTGTVLLTEVNELAVGQGDNADAFLAEPIVASLVAMATHYSASGSQTKAEDELGTYARTGSVVAGTKFNFARR